MLAAACAFLALLTATAAAQTLPGVECFSPGLLRAAQALQEQDDLRVTAEFTVENALYARDISVLRDMLSGTTLTVESVGGENGADALTIARGGVTLLDAALARDGSALRLNGRTIAPDEATLEALPQAKLWTLPGVASIVERVPLAALAQALEALRPGDALPLGLTVARAFAVERTFSDDGERLTRIDVSGAIAPPDAGEPYEVTGFLRQPGGRAPKDTFELTATQDEDNHFTLTYSSTRASEIERKNAKGEASVQTTLRSDGELEGVRIDSRLTVRLTNDWTADEDGLTEKIAVSATLGHTDRTPERRMQRLNDVAATLKGRVNVKTAEGQIGPVPLTAEGTLSVTMDGNDFLGGGVTLTALAGGEPALTAPAAPQTDGEAQADAREALDEALRALTAGLYAQLGESSIEKIESGL